MAMMHARLANDRKLLFIGRNEMHNIYPEESQPTVR